MEFDGKDLAAQNITKEEKNKSGEELINEIIERIVDLFNLQNIILYDSRIGKTSWKDITTIYLENIVKVDLKKFKINVDDLEKYLSNIAEEKFKAYPYWRLLF